MGAMNVTAELGVVSIDLAFGNNGKAWAKIRAVSKERVRDANGTWADGEPSFIDVYVNAERAEHLYESVAPGDQILVIGRLVNKEWTDKEGVKRDGWRINAWEIGPSMQFTKAPTKRFLEANGAPKDTQLETPDTSPEDPWAPPF
jgi:single-strand DNA-binding protein